MIDNEEIVYNAVSTALRGEFKGIFISGAELVDMPPKFPAVSIVRKDSSVSTKYSTFEAVENAASEEYEFTICSNLIKQDDAKRQTKNIVAVINGVMCDLYYIRSFCQHVPSVDSKITRLIARYKKNDIT